MQTLLRAWPFALAAAGLGTAFGAPAPLTDPLPQKIAKGNIAVALAPFLRAPQSFDPAKPPTTNDAHARLQYLLPVPGPGERLAFNDVRGFLYATDAAGAPPAIYLDLRRANVDFHPHAFPNEAGFLGFAFHPEFATPGKRGYGKLYTAHSAGPDSGAADYLDQSGENQESVIREWTTTDPSANTFRGTSREVFRVGQFAANHNVGTIAFNPTARPGTADYGLLYACLGDGGGRDDPKGYGQALAEPLGGIIRIDPLATDGTDAAYGIPPDNPFVGVAGAAPELWAYGLRHPQQFSWDQDGRLFIADIGQDQIEEVNIGLAGANYGWRLREGTFATAFGVAASAIGPVYARPAEDEQTFVYPVAQYDHDEGFAIGGGFVYRGSAIPALVGRYVFTDITRGRLFSIVTDDLVPGQPTAIEELRLVIDGREQDLVAVAGFANTYHGPDFPRVDARLGIDHDGELYVLTKGDGWIRKLVPVASASGD